MAVGHWDMLLHVVDCTKYAIVYVFKHITMSGQPLGVKKSFFIFELIYKFVLNLTDLSAFPNWKNYMLLYL